VAVIVNVPFPMMVGVPDKRPFISCRPGGRFRVVHVYGPGPVAVKVTGEIGTPFVKGAIVVGVIIIGGGGGRAGGDAVRLEGGGGARSISLGCTRGTAGGEDPFLKSSWVAPSI
jgi:hypothetical protein